ncbi:MAG TPA: T9SS type A sorting domain-containing protein [Cyclobacteriaceae bacterium]|nr:T9SS type A sorting domain-containing protein [Cyclobacteriaceae bacterium]
MKNWILPVLALVATGSAFAQTLIPEYHSPLPVRGALINTSIVQPDGKVLLGGEISFFGTQRVHGIIRLNTDGTIDNTFDPEIPGDLFVHEIEFQSTGNILVLASTFESPNDRFYPKASLYKFSSTGDLIDQIDDLEPVQRFTVQTDDKVLVPGTKLTRYNADFSPDDAFNEAIAINGTVNDIQQTGSSLLVAGRFSEVNGVTKNDIVKIDLDGNVDNSFDTGTGTNDNVGSLTILPNGKILIGRAYINSFNGTGAAGTVRLNADGSRDMTFNSFSSNGPISEIFVNGNDVYVGSFKTIDFQTKDWLLKLADNGSPDLSFTPVELQGAGSILLFIALGPDGIVINNAHKSANEFGIARYDYSGNQITSFKPQVGRFGLIVTAERYNDKLYVGGDFIKLDGFTTYGVGRLNENGTVDQNFKMQSNLGGATQLKPLDDGKIFVSTGPSFLKLNSSGDILPEFHWAPFGRLHNVSKFILRPNGKIVVVDPNNAYQLNADGTEDTSFDVGDGIQNIISTAFDIGMQGDKVIYGSSFDSFNNTPVKQLIRLNEDGAIDPLFNLGEGPAGDDNFTNVALIKVLDNNEILVGGSFNKFDNIDIPFQLLKLSPDGTVDVGFNENQKLGEGMNAKLVFPIDASVRTMGSQIYIAQKRAQNTGLYVINTDGLEDAEFTLPATVNFVTDMVVPSVAPGTADTPELFAIGSFKDIGSADPQSIIKISVKVPAHQNITFAAYKELPYSNDTYTLDATSSSGLPVWYTSSNEAVATVNGSIVTIKSVGVTIITARQSGNGDYAPAPAVPQTLEIVKAPQTITFNEIPRKKLTDAPFTLTASSTSGLPLTFGLSESDNGKVVTISGSTVTIIGEGSAIIFASQAGNEYYKPADVTGQILLVGKSDQKITFAALPAKTMGDSPFALTATSSSTLPVQFTTAGDKVTISGTQVTLVKPGKATITASQAGNDDYKSATPVDQTFCINPLKPVITKQTVTTAGGSAELKSSADAGNQWYVGGVAITGAISQNYIPTIDGLYTVRVTVDGCASAISDGITYVINGVNELHNNAVQVYPNPASSVLHVDLSSFEPGDVEVVIYNNTGNRVHGVTAQREAEISTADYTDGLYLVHASQNGKTLTAKFIKK